MAEPLLTKRAVVLAKIEGTYNVDPTPLPTLDAILVEDPDYMVDSTINERNFSRFDLDSLQHKVGRKLASMKFKHEWRTNGRVNSGLSADVCKLGRLLRACGFSETAIASGTSQVGAVNVPDENTGAAITWAASAGWAALTQPVLYTVVVTTGGASGTAKCSITPDPLSVAKAVDVAQTNVTLTSAAVVNLKSGGGGATITPTWSGNLVVGDRFEVWVYPVGILYMPVSSAVSSLTLYMYLDGILHKMTGALGTMSMSAEAGGYASAEFTFTGQYVAPVDAAIPVTARFESQQPATVELSDLMIDNFAAVVAGTWSVDLGNTISPRTDVNNADGYNGVRLVSRDVKGQVDPEMTPISGGYDWWSTMAASTGLVFRNKVGQVAGNRIWTLGQNVQLGDLGYGDRESIRTLDVPLKFNRKYGNDSVQIFMS